MAYEMMVVAEDDEAYWPLEAFAGDGLGGGILAAGYFQSAMGGDQVAAEEAPMQEAACVPLETMHQMALRFLSLGWSLHSVSAQEQMLAMPQMTGNYQAGGC